MKEAIIDMDDWIPVSGAAKLKGVRRQSIYYHINEGTLAKKEIVGRVCVKKEDLLHLKIRAASRNPRKTANRQNIA